MSLKKYLIILGIVVSIAITELAIAWAMPADEKTEIIRVTDDDLINVYNTVTSDIKPEPDEAIEAIVERHMYTKDNIDHIAQCLYAKARGCSNTQQEAVVWCILNRVDSELFPNSIREVIDQGFTWNCNAPVTEEFQVLAEKVLSEWEKEKSGLGVYRVLPSDYLYFYGDGEVNHFYKEWGNRTDNYIPQ